MQKVSPISALAAALWAAALSASPQAGASPGAAVPPGAPPGATQVAAPPGATQVAVESARLEVPVFVDRAQEWGLDFVHDNGATGEFYFPEINGAGGALFDFDGDGDLDVYLVDSGPLPPGSKPGKPDRLFRNEARREDDGTLTPRFVNVTEKAGLRALGYGMGVATADFDNDGDVDLYVANYGPNQLWRNNGDGTFTDVTAKAGGGLDDAAWSIGASFFDFDRDGWLDLYVINYVDFPLEKNPACYTESSRRDYCGPSAFRPVADRLLRNRRDGTFEDVSVAAGVARQAGAGLGAVTADLDGDGWVDIYVANDGQANFLWLNQQDGTFRDDALFAGVAVNRMGQPEASMGVDAGDFDADGDTDLFMTHLMGESNTLYVNDGGALFEDRSTEAGLASGSFPFTSFGTSFADLNNDGWLDLLVLSGAVRVLEPLARQGDPYPLDQPNLLFLNEGGKRFVEVSERAGEVFELLEVSRGAAFGDIDDDGDLDVLLTNNQGRTRLLVNGTDGRKPWLGLSLLGGTPPRDQLGARIEVRRRGAPTLVRRCRTDGSYASAQDPRILVGLGDHPEVTAIVITWPDGTRESFPTPTLDRYTRLVRGTAPPEKSTETSAPTGEASSRNAGDDGRRR